MTITAAEAASRHEFWSRATGANRAAAWRLPVPDSDAEHAWHATGSLLGLDARLAEFSLVRVSSTLPLRRPTLNDEDRRGLVEAVALVNSIALTDADRDAVVAAIRNGRSKLAAVGTPDDAVALADAVPLSAARRSLFSWVVAYDRNRRDAFLSPTELFWLGMEKMPVSPRFDALGARGAPRLGCLCLQMPDRQPWENFAGRWNDGVLASTFPDLNIRLMELLAELRMPAALLGAVLAPATFDLINTAVSRDQDDRRGLVEFVHGLRADRVEQYLALLTTDGPLVPITTDVQRVGNTEEPR
jgi:hypothetical protein